MKISLVRYFESVLYIFMKKKLKYRNAPSEDILAHCDRYHKSRRLHTRSHHTVIHNDEK